jgi:hypothetical protein
MFAKTGTHRQVELITLLIVPRNRFRREAAILYTRLTIP